MEAKPRSESSLKRDRGLERGRDPNWPGHAIIDEIIACKQRLGVSSAQFARLVGVCPRTVERWVLREGNIPAIHVRRRLRELIERSKRLDLRDRPRRRTRIKFFP